MKKLYETINQYFEGMPIQAMYITLGALINDLTATHERVDAALQGVTGSQPDELKKITESTEGAE